jgi:hypothetical protein
MLPSVSQVSDVEMIRDGGSLQASFVGANGSKYCLWFKLVTQRDSQGQHRRAGYSNPIVFERLEFHHPNSFEWRSANQVEVSWEHATTLLHQFRNHPLSDAQARWLAAMEKVATLRGGLPGDFQTLGAVQMAELDEHLSRLKSLVDGISNMPPWTQVQIAVASDVSYSGPVPSVRADKLHTLESYRVPFQALLQAGHPWLNLTALGVAAGTLIVAVELPQTIPSFEGRTSVNLSGPLRGNVSRRVEITEVESQP